MATAKQQIALVTGANTGVGEAIARSLAKDHGYHVLIGSRRLEAGQAVAESLKSQGHSAAPIQLDLTDEASIQNVVRTIASDHGHLDVLVNNAGILIDIHPDYANHTLRQKLDISMATNAIGPASLTDALLPLLEKSVTETSVPRIVFLSSSMGSVALAADETQLNYPIDYRAYDASKAAANILALNFGRMLKPVGGMVNVVCPGLVDTKMTQVNPALKPYCRSPQDAAAKPVEMATLAKGGPTCTWTRNFMGKEETLPW